MSKDVMTTLRERARTSPQRIVFPEASEPNILQAARHVKDQEIGVPLLLGQSDDLARAARECGVDIGDLEIVDPGDASVAGRLVAECLELFPEMSQKSAERKLRSPLNAGALLVATSRADAMVAGLAHATHEVILASMSFIGMSEGISTPSSLFLMRVPGFNGPEGELLVFADCGVAVDPDAIELADIALTTAHTVRALLEWEPRVAMLSYSTTGSGSSESVDKVLEALRLAKERAPSLAIDGEFQLDAAIVPEVASRKIGRESQVAGRANVLIFPDLDAGNIAYKCVQRLAGGDAFGPFLQGFAKTVSDLSRGSSVADIVGVSTLAAAHAQGLKRLQAERENRR
jgi:phosphate acetyltransferase